MGDLRKYVDRVVVASDDKHDFLNFFPVVAAAWRKFYNIEVTLAFVTHRNPSDPLVAKLKSYGRVELLTPNNSAPAGNQAKMARFYVAAQYKNEVSTIEDIDTIPLNGSWVISKVKNLKHDRLLGIGSEVYVREQERGKFPASTITGRGDAFDRFFNVGDKTFSEFVEQFRGFKVVDCKEDPFNAATSFSDESLIRAIRQEKSRDIFDLIERNVDISSEWVDRSNWVFSHQKLKSGDYLFANMKRPFVFHTGSLNHLLQEVFDKSVLDEVLLQPPVLERLMFNVKSYFRALKKGKKRFYETVKNR